jgi:hypothetical protein
MSARKLRHWPRQRGTRYRVVGASCAVVASLLAFTPRPSFARETHPTQSSSAPIPASPNPAQPYWSQSRARLFLSGRALAGLGYGRLAFSAGYGKPHFIWAGLDTVGVATPYFASAQAGVQVSLAVAHLSVALRHTASFSHRVIPETDSVDSSDLERGDERARYDVVDSSLWGVVPYRPFLLSWEATYVKPLALEQGTMVYEEIQRAVVTGHGLFTTKLSPMLSLLSSDRLFVGVLGEHLSLLGRSDPLVVRLGPSVWAQLTNHLELCAYLTWPVVGSDQLGFWDGMYGTVGAVYRFATGDPWSRFP